MFSQMHSHFKKSTDLSKDEPGNSFENFSILRISPIIWCLFFCFGWGVLFVCNLFVVVLQVKDGYQ